MRAGMILPLLFLLSSPRLARADEAAPAPPAPAPIARVAAATPEPAAPAADAAAPRAEPARPEIHLNLGFRGNFLPSPGLDPYATNDFVFQGSVALGLTVVRAGNASILIGAGYDGGTRAATARGQQATLGLHRFSGVVETRYQPLRRLYFAARAVPSALLMAGSISESAIDRSLTESAWVWGLEVSGGAGLLLGQAPGGRVKFWLTADAGYTFAGQHEMSYAPAASEDDPRTYGSIMLPALKPAGATTRLGFGISF